MPFVRGRTFPVKVRASIVVNVKISEEGVTPDPEMGAMTSMATPFKHRSVPDIALVIERANSPAEIKF
jgi:hypothetical protein